MPKDDSRAWSPDKWTWQVGWEEKFWFMGMAFDIQRAKQILAVQKKNKLVEVDVNQLKPFLGKGNNRGLFTVAIDWEKAKKDEINLVVPLIIAHLPKTGALMVIDGWHRVAKAILQDIPFLQGVILGKRDSKRII